MTALSEWIDRHIRAIVLTALPVAIASYAAIVVTRGWIAATVTAAIVSPLFMQLAAIFILHRASRVGDDPILVMLERLWVAQCGFLGALIIAFLAINGALDRPIPIGPPFTSLLVALALLIIALPAGVFSWLYWTDRLGEE